MNQLLNDATAFLGFLLLASPANAASFDCAKAQTKIERQICADAELSLLDERLDKIFSKVFKENALYHESKGMAVMLQKEQRSWLKQRNLCGDTACLRDSYLNRIAAIDSYKLEMSKDDDLCNHMLQQFNEDLFVFDRARNRHGEFESIAWKPARFSYEHDGRIEYTDVEGALFDFNNDGLEDFVVRWKASLSGMPAESIYVLESSAAARANGLVNKELFDAMNQIAIAGDAYELSPPLEGQSKALWLLSPFRYRGTFYVYMQSLYMGKSPSADFAVIAKYQSGRFVMREMTGRMEDVCYIKRVGVNSIK